MELTGSDLPLTGTFAEIQSQREPARPPPNVVRLIPSQRVTGHMLTAGVNGPRGRFHTCSWFALV